MLPNTRPFIFHFIATGRYLLLCLSLFPVVTLKAEELKGNFQKPGIIFTREVTEKIGGKSAKYAFWDSGPPYWQPNNAQIAELESRLIEFLGSAEVKKDKMASGLAAKAPTYWRQYVGVTSTEGRKVVLVNAFCNSLGKTDAQLKREMLDVDDGGNCFFRVHYDPEKKTFSRFATNGVA